MAWGAELARVALGAEDREQVLESVSQTFRVVVAEFVDDLEEGPQRLGIAIGQIGIFEDVAEELGDARILRHPVDGFGIEIEDFVSTQPAVDQPGPAVAGEVAGKEFTLTAPLLTPGIDVIHEFIDKGDGDLLDLALGVGNFAHQDVAGGVDAAFGVGIQHGFPLGGELVQGDVILDILGNQGLELLRNGMKVPEGKDGVGGQLGEIPGIDDVPDLVARHVSLEIGFDGRHGLGLRQLLIGDEFVEFLFQQFVPGLETRDEVEDLFQDLTQGQATVHGGCFA